MTWTYSGNPGASVLDEVRFLIQDTDTTDQLLSNEELNYLIDAFDDSAYGAAISAVVSLIGTAARATEESKKVGDLSLTRKAGLRLQQWEGLLGHLRAEQFRRAPVAPIANPNSIIPTVDKVDEDASSDYPLGWTDNKS
jgi:hypothetical protein